MAKSKQGQKRDVMKYRCPCPPIVFVASFGAIAIALALLRVTPVYAGIALCQYYLGNGKTVGNVNCSNSDLI